MAERDYHVRLPPGERSRMQPEYCPYHRSVDTCLAVARLLAEAGLLDTTPDAPAVAGPVVDIPAVPPQEVTLVLLARRINQWGRVVIDPTLPHVDVTTVDERSLRYTLQALWEESGAGIRQMIGAIDSYAPMWWRVRDALQSAHTAASRTTADNGPDDQALWWYIALLHLDRAHQVWKEDIGRPLQAGRGRSQ